MQMSRSDSLTQMKKLGHTLASRSILGIRNFHGFKFKWHASDSILYLNFRFVYMQALIASYPRWTH